MVTKLEQLEQRIEAIEKLIENTGLSGNRLLKAAGMAKQSSENSIVKQRIQAAKDAILYQLSNSNNKAATQRSLCRAFRTISATEFRTAASILADEGIIKIDSQVPKNGGAETMVYSLSFVP